MTLASTTSAPATTTVLAAPTALERSSALATTASRSAPRLALPRTWIAAGLLALAGVAGAAYWAGRTSSPADATAGLAQPLPASPLPAPLYSATPPTTPTPTAPPEVTAGTGGHGSAAPAHGTASTAPAPVCTHCGLVESVQAVQHKGQANGVGAVAGGVLGGVLGHQMGGGNGRTAMTVLGAVGGGMAGNEVEKRSKATTTYRVQVRTDSGALRTLEQRTPPAVGQRVRIDGATLHAIAS